MYIYVDTCALIYYTLGKALRDKAYSQNKKQQLYKLKRKRSISEAKVDRFVPKLNQGINGVCPDLYATCNSVYLDPSP